MIARERCREPYNLRFNRMPNAMEAEQLNQIAASLKGLGERTADLRRYL
jgi:hypothetical protein